VRYQHNTSAMTTSVRQVLALLLTGLLSACGSHTVKDSGPDREIDVSNIPDAKPRHTSHSRYGNPDSYVVYGVRYRVMKNSKGYLQRGIASWYGNKFHGRRTSSGEAYDMYAMTAAHKSLPLPTYVQVTNLDNGRQVVVKVNDRGPFVKNRIIDLSYTAAKKLGITATGTGLVEVRAINTDHPPAQKPRTTTSKTVTAALPSDLNMYLQVGAFANRINAEQLQITLQKLLSARVSIERMIQNQLPLFRVRVGPVASVSELDRMTDLLGQQGINSPRIVID